MIHRHLHLWWPVPHGIVEKMKNHASICHDHDPDDADHHVGWVISPRAIWIRCHADPASRLGYDVALLFLELHDFDHQLDCAVVLPLLTSSEHVVQQAQPYAWSGC